MGGFDQIAAEAFVQIVIAATIVFAIGFVAGALIF